MQRRLLSLSGLGFVALLGLGPAILSAHADDTCRPKSPVRGAWSYTQFEPLFQGAATPITQAGILTMDGCGGFTGHAVLNLPDPAFTGFEFNFDGTCTPRGEVSNGMDCLVNVPDLGLANVRRFCVVMEQNREGCFEEFRCINTDGVNEAGTVLLVEFKRQKLGGCK